MRIYLIRHGETAYNKDRMIQGYSEVALNDTGIAQAGRLARRLAAMPLDRIYASDLRRAAMTAAIVAAYTGAPILYEPLFRERNPGDLVDLTYEEAMRFFTDRDFAPPGGETFAHFEDRVDRAFESLIRSESELGGGHVAVVTHGMVCAGFLLRCIGRSPEEMAGARWPNASLTIADYNGRWDLVMMGDATHLDGLGRHSEQSTGG